MASKTKKREGRSFTTSEIVTSFGRFGVARDVMARALVVARSQVDQICRRAVERDEIQIMPPESPTDMRAASLSELTNLRHTCDVQQAIIRELTNAQEQSEFIGIASLTTREAAIVAHLAKRPIASKQALFTAVYGISEDVPEPKIIDVFICKIRRKLAPHGIEIDTVWGRGYRMTHASVAKLRRVAEREAAGEPVESPPLVPEQEPVAQQCAS